MEADRCRARARSVKRRAVFALDEKLDIDIDIDLRDMTRADEARLVCRGGMLEGGDFDAGRTRIEDQDGARSGLRANFGPGLHHQHRQRAGRDACEGTISPACEDYRHARAYHQPGGLRIAELLQLLGEHVAGLHVGGDQDVGLACRR